MIQPVAREKTCLPHGFVVELNYKVRLRDGGRALIGGAPTRALYLTNDAQRMFENRTLRVSDAGTGALADRLLENGMADPVLAELPAGDGAQVTFVVPVRNRPDELNRLLDSLGAGHRTIVVDDCSTDPETIAEIAAKHGALLVPLPINVGPAGARNAGLRRVTTAYVAFVDSDVVVQRDTVSTLLRHFADPKVAIVAPRVLGLPVREGTNWIGRYEEARSSLDLGVHQATVRPRAPVSWVSSSCLIARVEAIGDGFSAEMRVGEDVDLVWRLAESGWRIRYEPAAQVWHEHRVKLGDWMSRKAFYGTGAHALAQRHGYNAAPAVLAPWSVGVIIAVLAQRRWSVPAVLGFSAVTVVQIAGKLNKSEQPVRVSLWLTSSGVLAALGQAMELLLRHWWPLTIVGCVFSKRVRRAVLVSAVLDVALEYRRTDAKLDPFRFGLARRLDDLAYGAGVWLGAIRGRSLIALVPDIRRRRRSSGS